MNAITGTQVSRNYWWTMGIRGLLAVLFGLAALVWPRLTLLVLVYLFGAYALVDGVVAVIVSIQERKNLRYWWVLLLEGIAGIIGGGEAFGWARVRAFAPLFLFCAGA